MRSYNLNWDKKIKDIILSYTECRKVFIDNIEYVKILLKEDISDDDYHLYEYNSKVKFLIKNIMIKDDKIDHMIVYLLSNDLKEINNLYSKIRDNSSDEYTYIKNKENMEKFFKTNLFNELAKEKDLQQIKNIINYCWYDDKNKIFYVKKGDLPQYLIKNFYNLKEKIEAKKITKLEIVNSSRKPIQNAEKIYWDPDRVDENLYSTFTNKNHLQYNPYIDENYTQNKCHFQSSKDTNIKLALDAIIGWKAIMDILFEENNEIEDIKKVTEIYQIIRNPENGGHLIWPQHRR